MIILVSAIYWLEDAGMFLQFEHAQDYTSEHRSRAPSPERKGTVSAAPSKRSVPSVERTPAVYARSGAVPATADEIEGEGPRPYRGIFASETSMSCSSRPPDPAGTTGE